MTAKSISTQAGDRGQTRLASGETVPKSDPRLEALGAVDELVSFLGLARAAGLAPEREMAVLAIQKDLFRVGAEVAWIPEAKRGIEPEDVSRLDVLCRALESETPMPSGFVVPGATSAGAALDTARAMARRCERCVTSCLGAHAGSPLQAWLNRVSDVLWLMARAEDAGTSPGAREGS